MGKGSSAQRGYGTAWRKLRLKALEVYGPICYICKEDIDTTLKSGPMMYSLDHLRPIAHYGYDLPSIEDVRPTHKGCNSRKKHRIKVRPQSRNWHA